MHLLEFTLPNGGYHWLLSLVVVGLDRTVLVMECGGCLRDKVDSSVCVHIIYFIVH